MQIFPEEVSKDWNGLQIRFMVVVSLTLQSILILIGNRRKLSSRTGLRFILWLTYLSADWVATVSLSVISVRNLQPDKDEAVDPKFILTAFWVPFLLQHLGGPDTITAYSLEDNELWWRHALMLIVQLSVAIYTGLKAWNGNVLNYLSIPMFISGIYRCLERTWALRSASSNYFRQSMFPRPDPGPNYARFMEEYSVKRDEGFVVSSKKIFERSTTTVDVENKGKIFEGSTPTVDVENKGKIFEGSTPTIDVENKGKIFEGSTPTIDVENKGKIFESSTPTVDVKNNIVIVLDTRNLQEAYYFFSTFKRLFADLILSINDIRKSRAFFQSESDRAKVFNVIEIELGYLYDLLYTKANVNYSVVGVISRLVSLFLVIFVCLFFFFIGKQDYLREDIIITYILLAGAFFLELCSIALLASSDWTMLWLSMRKTVVVDLLRRALLTIFPPKRHWWSNEMTQYNLIRYSLQEEPAKCSYLQKSLGIDELMEKYLHRSFKRVPDELKNLVFNELLRKSMSDPDFSVCKKLGAHRGLWVLEREGYIEKLGRRIEDVEFDESILLWHIATDLCYYSESDMSESKQSSNPKEISKLLSDYMLYLLVMQPFMLPNGIGQIRFQDTCAEASEFIQERKSIRDVVNTEKPPSKVKGDSAEASVKRACELLLQVNTEIPPSEVKGDKSKSVLFDACQLAKALREPQTGQDLTMWELVSYVWVEMLCHAASKCQITQHIQQLRRGGELLTHVWLLMAHLGITEQFQISKGHARVKLIAK